MDGRTNQYVVALRAVSDRGLYDAYWVELPYILLAKESKSHRE
jgi:hypothetical protein